MPRLQNRFLAFVREAQSGTLFATSASFAGLTAAEYCGASYVVQRLVALSNAGELGKEISVLFAQSFALRLSNVLR